MLSELSGVPAAGLRGPRRPLRAGPGNFQTTWELDGDQLTWSDPGAESAQQRLIEPWQRIG